MKKSEKQLSDKNVYRKVEFKGKILTNVVEISNRFFKILKIKGWISDKNLKGFIYEFKNSSSLSKLYLLPKIHKRSFDVPRRPVISNFGTAKEKVK